MQATAAPDPRRWKVLGALCVALLVISVDNTILNVALPTIERDLDASSSALQWIVDSYMLVFAGLLLSMGSLGDRFGRRRALAAGLAIFGASSTWAALATDPGMLITARATMGVGGALIMPATLSIIMNVFPPAERPKAIGMWAGVFGIGIALGPTTGGLLLEHFDWGSVFLVNVPIVLVALALAARLVPESRDADAPPTDFAGAALSIAGLSTLVYGLIEAPAEGWASAPTLTAFAVATAFLTAFVAWELRVEHPMLDVRLFGHVRFTGASTALGLASFALLGSIFFVTQYLQGVLGLSALEAGVRLLPVAGGMLVGAPLSARVAQRFGTRATVAVGMAAVAAGLGTLGFADQGDGYGIVAASMVTLAFGMGLAMAPATESVMSVLPLAKAGVGSAMNDTLRLVGGSLGVAVLGSVLSSGYRGGMDGAPEAAKESLGHALQAGDPALARTAVDAFTNGMHSAAIVAAAVAFAGAVVAFALLPARTGCRPGVAVGEPATV